jgi:hypothetical protein
MVNEASKITKTQVVMLLVVWSLNVAWLLLMYFGLVGPVGVANEIEPITPSKTLLVPVNPTW